MLQVPYYDYALDMILDADSPNNEILTEEQHELVESAAEMLYGLIHVRYIVTTRGMSTMFEKYKQCEFGRCPRVLCNDQPTLPVGLADTPRQNTVKIYCPRCGDIYCPRYKYQVGCPPDEWLLHAWQRQRPAVLLHTTCVRSGATHLTSQACVELDIQRPAGLPAALFLTADGSVLAELQGSRMLLAPLAGGPA